MKKLIFILTVMVGISSFSQEKSNTGPKAKNFKFWKHKNVTTIVTFNKIENNKLFGSEFKNLKIWNRKILNEKTNLSKNVKIVSLQGPKAKNHKPWKK